MAVARAVFLDKDGTLVENVPYNVDPAKVVLARGAQPALAALAGAGYRLIVVSNQPGAAMGMFAGGRLAGVERRLQSLVQERLNGFYYCLHRPSAGCACRKPQPGLLLQAARDWDVDLGRSWMVGDILDDIEAGRRAGCRTCLIDNGNETEWTRGPQRAPHVVAPDLAAAAAAILRA